VSRRDSDCKSAFQIRTIDNGGPTSVNVYHWIVSVYGNVEGLRFFVAFSLLSLLKAGLDSPAFLPTRGFSLPQSSPEKSPCLLTGVGGEWHGISGFKVSRDGWAVPLFCDNSSRLKVATRRCFVNHSGAFP
jgi:hypothetical protein